MRQYLTFCKHRLKVRGLRAWKKTQMAPHITLSNELCQRWVAAMFGAPLRSAFVARRPNNTPVELLF